jgi:hypothetical protein
VEEETINGKKQYKWVPDEMVCSTLNIIIGCRTNEDQMIITGEYEY